jgi:hypothetical protein
MILTLLQNINLPADKPAQKWSAYLVRFFTIKQSKNRDGFIKLIG